VDQHEEILVTDIQTIRMYCKNTDTGDMLFDETYPVTDRAALIDCGQAMRLKPKLLFGGANLEFGVEFDPPMILQRFLNENGLAVKLDDNSD
jgi:hypothetical protein